MACQTCIFSRWNLTPTGKIQKNECGQCESPLPDFPVLSDSVTKAYGYSSVWKKGNIWPDDGRNCPMWKENEGNLIPIQ